MKLREKERGREGEGRGGGGGEGGGRKESYMCMEVHGFRNSLYVHRGRPCPFLRLVFCQECVASGYAVYMTLNTLPLFALRIMSLYLFSLYLDEAQCHPSIDARYGDAARKSVCILSLHLFSLCVRFCFVFIYISRKCFRKSYQI